VKLEMSLKLEGDKVSYSYAIGEEECHNHEIPFSGEFLVALTQILSIMKRASDSRFKRKHEQIRKGEGC